MMKKTWGFWRYTSHGQPKFVDCQYSLNQPSGTESNRNRLMEPTLMFHQAQVIDKTPGKTAIKKWHSAIHNHCKISIDDWDGRCSFYISTYAIISALWSWGKLTSDEQLRKVPRNHVAEFRCWHHQTLKVRSIYAKSRHTIDLHLTQGNLKVIVDQVQPYCWSKCWRCSVRILCWTWEVSDRGSHRGSSRSGGTASLAVLGRTRPALDLLGLCVSIHLVLAQKTCLRP